MSSSETGNGAGIGAIAENASKTAEDFSVKNEENGQEARNAMKNGEGSGSVEGKSEGKGSEDSPSEKKPEAGADEPKKTAEDPAAPAETTPAPAETTPAKAETTPAPAETTPAPAETTPAPAETTPAPAETTSAPTEEKKAEETTEAPKPAEQPAAPAEATPAEADPAEATPVETTSAEEKKAASAEEKKAEETTEAPKPEAERPAPPAAATPAETTTAPTEEKKAEETTEAPKPAEQPATPAEATPAEAAPAESTPAEPTPAETTPALAEEKKAEEGTEAPKPSEESPVTAQAPPAKSDDSLLNVNTLADAPKSDISVSPSTASSSIPDGRHFCGLLKNLPLPAPPVSEHNFLHDVHKTDETVVKWARTVAASSVHRLFYAHNTIVTRDAKASKALPFDADKLNRFSDIHIIEGTRVRLAGDQGGFIHANFVDGFRRERRFILSQSPQPGAVDKFWELIWQEKVPLIASTGDQEAAYYPPTSGQRMEVGTGDKKITIENEGVRTVLGAYDAVVLQVSRPNCPSRRVLLLELWDWARTALPRRPSRLLAFVSDIRHNYTLLRQAAASWADPSDAAPILLHDVAGIGPAAVLAVLDIVIEKLETTAVNGHKPLLDIDDVILRMRSQRFGAVNKPSLYVVIVLAVLEFAVRRRFFDEDGGEKPALDNYALDFEK